MEMEWQSRALRTIDLVPELDYATRFYSKMLAPLRLFPAKVLSDGRFEEIKSGPPVEVLDRIRDSGGGKAQILSNYGRLMAITGEGNLFGYDLGSEEETWIFCWNDELRVERGKSDEIKKIIWTPAANSVPREFGPDEAVVYKFWTPHPRRSGEAGSPMRAIIEGNVAEELIALTRSVLSTATSRATRGVLIIPQEIQPPPSGTDGDEDPETNAWITMIAEHLEAQIAAAGSPAAAAPYLMDPPYEYADRIRLLQLHDPQHDYLEKELRKEAVERCARGMDFPIEALMGIGATNHWAALQILMDMWRTHGAPLAQQLTADLTSVYYQPTLRDMDYVGWQETVIAADPSALTTKPDRTEDVKLAAEYIAIGPKGIRKLLNIPEDMAPEADELLHMLKARGRQRQEPRREDEEDSDRGTPEDGPEEPGPEGDSGRRTRITASADRRMGVIELAVMRCRELAGIRIKQKATRHFPDHLAFIEGQPFADIAASLGKELVKTMGLGGSVQLVAGGADNLRSLLAVWGYGLEQADLFAEIVEAHAANTLFQAGFPVFSAQLATLAGSLEEAA
jgi:hypothetical protein